MPLLFPFMFFFWKGRFSGRFQHPHSKPPLSKLQIKVPSVKANSVMFPWPSTRDLIPMDNTCLEALRKSGKWFVIVLMVRWSGSWPLLSPWNISLARIPEALFSETSHDCPRIEKSLFWTRNMAKFFFVVVLNEILSYGPFFFKLTSDLVHNIITRSRANREHGSCFMKLKNEQGIKILKENHSSLWFAHTLLEEDK